MESRLCTRLKTFFAFYIFCIFYKVVELFQKTFFLNFTNYLFIIFYFPQNIFIGFKTHVFFIVKCLRLFLKIFFAPIFCYRTYRQLCNTNEEKIIKSSLFFEKDPFYLVHITTRHPYYFLSKFAALGVDL